MRSARVLLAATAVLTAVAFGAGPARAQDGTAEFDVLWESGDPLPGAEIRVYQDEEVQGAIIHANERGHASTQLPPGTYSAVVTGSNHYKESKTFTVRPGATTHVTFQRLPPYNAVGPPLMVGLGFIYDHSPDLVGTAFYDRRQDIVNGTAGPVQNRDPGTRLQNRTHDFDVKTNVWAADVAIPLFVPKRDSTVVIRPFVPYLTLTGGRADLEFGDETNSLGTTVLYKGDVYVYGAGVGFTWDFSPDCRWFGTGEIGFLTSQKGSVSRTPGATSSTGDVTRERYTLELGGSRAQLGAGYDFGSWALTGGLRYQRRTVDLDAKVDVDFSQAAGTPYLSKFSSGSHHRDSTLEAVAGVDWRFGKSRLFGRVQGATDGDTESLFCRLTYRFGRR